MEYPIDPSRSTRLTGDRDQRQDVAEALTDNCSARFL
jgi:hypothetical protein